MNINEIQINRANRKILKNLLDTGVIPDDNTYLYYANEYFSNNIPGIPTMQLNKVPKRRPLQDKSIMNKDRYNEMLDTVEEDLVVLYQAILANNKNIIENFSYLESLRKKYTHEINTINNLIDNVLEESSSNEVYNTISENFYDFTNIQIDDTDAFVDTNNNSLILEPEILDSSMINQRVEDIKLESYHPEGLEVVEITKPESLVNDYLNESYTVKIKPDKDLKSLQQVSLTLLIEFDSHVNLSHLDISTNEKDNQFINIEAFDYSWESIPLSNNTIYGNSQWTFEPVNAEKIKLTITKNIQDEGLRDYYVFNIQDISLYNTEFKKSGSLKTKKFKIDNNEVFEKVRLRAEENKPNNTDIKYIVSLFNNDQTINIELKNKEEIRLNNTTTDTDFINYDNITREYNYYGHNYFVLDKKFNNIIENETKLYKGIGQWQKKTFQMFRDIDYPVSLSDWKMTNNVNTSYSSKTEKRIYKYFYITSGQIYPIKDGNPKNIQVKGFKNGSWSTINGAVNDDVTDKYKYISVNSDSFDLFELSYEADNINYYYETHILSEDIQFYQTRKFDIPETVSNYNYPYRNALYINNSRIQQEEENGKFYYNIKLQKGWNRIIFIDYHDSNVDGDLINLSNINTKDIRGHRKPATFAYSYDFLNKIRNYEDNYFSLVDNKVLINNPVKTNYRLEYTKPVNHFNEAVIEAQLQTSSKYVTPQAHNINVDFSY